MMVIKKCMLLLLVLSLLLACAGCAVKEDPVHPPKYSMLAPLMHRPLEEFYKETGLTEENLIRKGRGYYELPDTVTFCDLPFTVSIFTDPANEYLVSFFYSYALTGSEEEKAATLQSLALYFTEELGSSHDCLSEWYAGVDKYRMAEMSVAELSKLISSQENYTNKDYWCLEIADEEKTRDYKAILKASKTGKVPDDTAVPTILLTLETAVGGPDLVQMVAIYYTIDYYWRPAESNTD